MKLFPLGRLSSDIIESFFSELKYKYKKIGPAQVQNALRMNAVANVSFRATDSNTGFFESRSIVSGGVLVLAAKGIRRDRSIPQFNFNVSTATRGQEETVSRLIPIVARNLKLSCGACDYLVNHPPLKFRQMILECNCYIDNNISVIIKDQLRISVFINQVMTNLALPGYARIMNICCSYKICELFAKEFCTVRIREICKDSKQAPKERPDSSVTL